MKSFDIKKIIVPTDFSETANLAVEHAAFMARLYRADLYLFHAIEISETTFSIYNPVEVVRNLNEVENIVQDHLNVLANKLKQNYAIGIHTICTHGKAAMELTTAVADNSIDLIVMGTHGVSGFNEFFVGSNAHKTVTLSKCPVVTVQKHANKLGFSNIILPIFDSIHSLQKVDYTVALAKMYGARIHLLGLFDKNTDYKKLNIKLVAVEKVLQHAGIIYDVDTIKDNNPAGEVLKYSEKINSDLIVILTNHESEIAGMFLGTFAKQIVNHSKIPVLSIKPVEGKYESVSLAASAPF